MVLIGDNFFCVHQRANTIYSDEWYSEATDNISKNATTMCPHCRRNQMPLRHKSLNFLGCTYPWVGVEYQDCQMHYETKCSKCCQAFQFAVRFEG